MYLCMGSYFYIKKSIKFYVKNFYISIILVIFIHMTFIRTNTEKEFKDKLFPKFKITQLEKNNNYILYKIEKENVVDYIEMWHDKKEKYFYSFEKIEAELNFLNLSYKIIKYKPSWSTKKEDMIVVEEKYII